MLYFKAAHEQNGEEVAANPDYVEDVLQAGARTCSRRKHRPFCNEFEQRAGLGDARKANPLI